MQNGNRPLRVNINGDPILTLNLAVMMDAILPQKQMISSKWAEYYAHEAILLSLKKRSEIENYMDGEVINPRMAKLVRKLETETTLLSGLDEDELLTLHFHESITASSSFQETFSGFKRLKKRIRILFCQVVQRSMANGTSDLPTLTSSTVLTIIPTLGAGSLVVMPVLTGFLALFIKYGLSEVCHHAPS